MASDSPIGSAIEGFTKGFIRAREESEQRNVRAGAALYDAAKQDPTLFDDPDSAKKITAYLGGKEPFELIRAFHQNQGAPEKGAFNQLSAMGGVSPEDAAQTQQREVQRSSTIAQNAPQQESAVRSLLRPLTFGALGPGTQPAAAPLPSPYTGSTQKLAKRVGATPGASMKLTEKGGTSVNLTAPTRSESGGLDFYRAVTDRTQALMAEGAPEATATLQAHREGVEYADANGVLVPKEARALANATTTQQVQVRLKAAVRAAERAIETQTERGIRREGEMGSREGKLGAPISSDETAAAKAQAVASTLEQAGEPLSPLQWATLTDTFRREASVLQVGEEAAAREAGTSKGRMTKGAPQPTPVPERTKLQEVQNGLDDLNKVFTLFNPQMLGGIKQGKFTNLKGYFGALKVNEERLRTNVYNATRRIRIATTGAAGPAEELQRITDETINTNQTPPQFFARMMELARQARDTHANITNTLKANNEVAPPLEINPELKQIIDAFEAEDAQRNQQPAAAETGNQPQLPEGWTLTPAQ